MRLIVGGAPLQNLFVGSLGTQMCFHRKNQNDKYKSSWISLLQFISTKRITAINCPLDCSNHAEFSMIAKESWKSDLLVARASFSNINSVLMSLCVTHNILNLRGCFSSSSTLNDHPESFFPTGRLMFVFDWIAGFQSSWTPDSIYPPVETFRGSSLQKSN